MNLLPEVKFYLLIIGAYFAFCLQNFHFILTFSYEDNVYNIFHLCFHQHLRLLERPPKVAYRRGFFFQKGSTVSILSVHLYIHFLEYADTGTYYSISAIFYFYLFLKISCLLICLEYYFKIKFSNTFYLLSFLSAAYLPPLIFGL